MKISYRMIVVLGVVLVIAGCSEQATKSAKDAAQQAADKAKESAKSLMVGDVDAGKDLTALFGSLTKTLGGITSVETAKESLPQITEAETKLSSLNELLDKLPAEAKPIVSEMVKKGLGSLQPLLDKVLAIPGVREVVESKLNGIMGKLKQIAG
jgi:hypothetical protein